MAPPGFHPCPTRSSFPFPIPVYINQLVLSRHCRIVIPPSHRVQYRQPRKYASMVDREPRPRIVSMGNSLTSISSLTTLPPSPVAQPRSAYVPLISVNKPTETDVDPLGLTYSFEPDNVIEGPLSPPGSVPSPKPRFAHLHASAPSRPRLPRAPSYTRTRIPSPLNPASQHLKPTPSLSFNLNPVDGSVPNPKPNRLFTSLYYQPLTAPNTTEPKLPNDQEPLSRCPPRLRNGQKGSAPRKISPSGSGSSNIHSSIPASLPVPGKKLGGSPEDQVSENSITRAPSSFSTFVASIESSR
jgi:hypothetical protein